MSAERNIAQHIRWSVDNDRHDLSNYREYMHADVEIYHLDGETVRGVDAVTKNMAASIRAMPDRRVVVEDRFATEDRVVCRWRVEGAVEESALGPRVDEPVRVVGISVWEFIDGKVRRGWVLSNAAYLAQQGMQGAHAIGGDALAEKRR